CFCISPARAGRHAFSLHDALPILVEEGAGQGAVEVAAAGRPRQEGTDGPAVRLGVADRQPGFGGGQCAGRTEAGEKRASTDWAHQTTSKRLLEQQRGELTERPPPRLPHVARAGRFVEDVVDARLRERLAQVLRTGALGRADAQEEDLHLAVPLLDIGKGAVAHRLDVDRLPAAEARAVTAEAGNIGELV